MLNKTFSKLLSLYLVVALALMTLPPQGWAMFIPKGSAEPARQEDIRTIRSSLETAMVKQRLLDFGLSPDEVTSRINQLSDEEVHQFASRLDSLQAGADGVDSLVFLLLVAIVVVVVLEATGHRVIIR